MVWPRAYTIQQYILKKRQVVNIIHCNRQNKWTILLHIVSDQESCDSYWSLFAYTKTLALTTSNDIGID